MRRGIGLTLTGLGAFLLVFGLLMRYWVPGQVLKFPLNEYQVTTLAGNDISYFSAPLLHEFAGVTATFIKTVEGDVPSGSASTAVWGSFTAIEDTKDNTAIQFLSQRSAFNRRTGVLVSCCGASIGGNTKIQQAGQGFVFPFGTQHKTYQLFDTTLLQTVPVQFAGTSSVDGLAVDKFTEQVQGRRFGQQTLPGSLVGEPAAGHGHAARVADRHQHLLGRPGHGLGRRHDPGPDRGAAGHDAIAATGSAGRHVHRNPG